MCIPSPKRWLAATHVNKPLRLGDVVKNHRPRNCTASCGRQTATYLSPHLVCPLGIPGSSVALFILGMRQFDRHAWLAGFGQCQCGLRCECGTVVVWGNSLETPKAGASSELSPYNRRGIPVRVCCVCYWTPSASCALFVFETRSHLDPSNFWRPRVFSLER